MWSWPGVLQPGDLNHPRDMIVATDLARVRITEEHSRAICAEIGDRLRVALGQADPISPDLSRLIARLGELDEHDAPSIVPEIEELAPALAAG